MAETKLLPGTELEDKAFYTIKDAAKGIGCHFQTLRNWIKAGTFYSTKLKGPASSPVVPRSEILRVRRKMEAKRAADEPSMGDFGIFARVEELVGAKNVYPLIKRLLAGWLEAHQADLETEVVDADVTLKKADALLHDVLAPEQKEKT